MDDSDEFLKDTAGKDTPAAQKPANDKAATKPKPAEKPAPAKSLVRKAYHRFGNMQVPATLPVSTQMCPPITKRKFAIYELLSYKDAKGKRLIDARVTQGDPQIEPQPYELASAYTIYDRFEEDLGKRDKIIQFVDGTETFTYDHPTTGQKERGLRPKVVVPFFLNGQRIVDVEAKYLQYLWWELHPRNQSNKFHDKTKKPIFRRVDLDHVNPMTELVKYTLRTAAHNRIDKIMETSRLKDLAAALGIPTGLPPTDIRLELHHRVDRDAEAVLYAEGDPTATTRLNVHKAMDMGIIDYLPDVQQFFFTNDSDKPLHTVLSGADPVEDLAKFLASEQGEEPYKSMTEVLEYWK